MKGIYFSQDLSHASGIEKKIYQQIDEFKLQGWQIDSRINGKRNTLHLLRNVVPFFSKQYFKTADIDWMKYEFVYLRKGAIFDQSFVKLVRQAKTANGKIKIIVEIPTYPYMDEFKGLLKTDIEMKEKLWVPKLKNYVDRIVTYSDDKEIFGIKCINISNAYDFTKNPTLKPKETARIELMAAAALTFYHGYDRVIEGLKDYYRDYDKEPDVHFTLIGDGPVLSSYQDKVAEYHLEKAITLAGRIPFDQLDEYYRNADIGVDSLGRHRSGVTYNSSLKGKEYLAKGIPSVSGVKTDLDGRGLPFYFRVPADDSPIDIVAIKGWYQGLLKDQSREEWAKEIFDYGKENFSFKKTFQPVIDYIKTGD